MHLTFSAEMSGCPGGPGGSSLTPVVSWSLFVTVTGDRDAEPVSLLRPYQTQQTHSNK